MDNCSRGWGETSVIPELAMWKQLLPCYFPSHKAMHGAQWLYVHFTDMPEPIVSEGSSASIRGVHVGWVTVHTGKSCHIYVFKICYSFPGFQKNHDLPTVMLAWTFMDHNYRLIHVIESPMFQNRICVGNDPWIMENHHFQVCKNQCPKVTEGFKEKLLKAPICDREEIQKRCTMVSVVGAQKCRMWL